MVKVMIKELIDKSISKLGSRLLSLRALLRVCDNWPDVLKVYFLGGQAHVALRDYKSVELSLRFDENSVNKVIQLARALFRCWGKYELRGDTISIHFTHHKESFRLPEVISNEIHFADLFGFSQLSHFNADARPLDEGHYIVFIDDLAWVVRKGVLTDIVEGPLLPYLHEPYEYRAWFLRALKAGGIFIDVGAYVGGYSIRACKLGAEVVALEPDGKNFLIHERNCKLNQCSRIRALNVAAGVKKGIKPLYAQELADAGMYSLVREGVLRGYVKVVPLDEAVLPIVSDCKVQLMKIDVEGAELEVLEGGLDALNRTRYLMIEVWPHTENHVLDLLKKRKFKLVDTRRFPNKNNHNVCYGPLYNAFFKRT